MERYTLKNALKLLKYITKMHENEPEFHPEIIMNDEAHFHLKGYVNEQNCHFWDSENPKMYIKKPLYPQGVTVWCGFWAGGIIGPYVFFFNEAGAAVSVNGLRFRTMINKFLQLAAEIMLLIILFQIKVESVFFAQKDFQIL